MFSRFMKNSLFLQGTLRDAPEFCDMSSVVHSQTDHIHLVKNILDYQISITLKLIKFLIDLIDNLNSY